MAKAKEGMWRVRVRTSYVPATINGQTGVVCGTARDSYGEKVLVVRLDRGGKELHLYDWQTERI